MNKKNHKNISFVSHPEYEIKNKEINEIDKDEYRLCEAELWPDDSDTSTKIANFRGQMACDVQSIIQGHLCYEDGREYIGQFGLNNEASGIGSMKYPNGVVFSGQWKDGKEVFGVWIYPDGHTLIAKYFDNNEYGFSGNEFYPNGTWSDGLFRQEDNVHVYGELIRPGEDASEVIDIYGFNEVLDGDDSE